MKEIWKSVTGRAEGFPYDVSNLGDVRHKDARWRLLTPYLSNRGYPTINLYWYGENLRISVHSLVADAFLGPPPGPIGCRPEEWQIDHIDMNKTNNKVSNLEWVTGVENKRRAYEAGAMSYFPEGEEHPRAKLTSKEVTKIRRLYKTGEYTHKQLGKKFEVDKTYISKIVRKEARVNG